MLAILCNKRRLIGITIVVVQKLTNEQSSIILSRINKQIQCKNISSLSVTPPSHTHTHEQIMPLVLISKIHKIQLIFQKDTYIQ